MSRVPGPPPLDGLKRQIAKNRSGSAGRSKSMFVRETYVLAREDARLKAREWFEAYPKQAY